MEGSAEAGRVLAGPQGPCPYIVPPHYKISSRAPVYCQNFLRVLGGPCVPFPDPLRAPTWVPKIPLKFSDPPSNNRIHGDIIRAIILF